MSGMYGWFSSTDRGDDGPHPLRAELTVFGRAQRHRPHAVVVVPSGCNNLGVPPDVFGEVVLVDHLGEVVAQLVLLGEKMRPVVVGFEAVAIEMVRDIYAGPGIAVLPPCSARARVLFHDGEADVGLLQPDAREDAPFSAAHHEDLEVIGAFGGQGRGTARIDALEVQLLADERAGSRPARVHRPPNPSFP